MLTRNRVTIFITLITLTFIIFSSSTSLAKYITFESKVEAESTVKQPQTHITKTTSIVMKESGQKSFFDQEPKLPVFLTFDDGPTEHTIAILDILKKYEVESTFFMLNQNIHELPEVVKKVKQNGHTIGCHGVTHKVENFYKTTTSPNEEMQTCGKSIEKVMGSKVPFIRVPFGSSPYLSSEQKSELDTSQFIMWDWNVDSQDWTMSSSDEIVQSVLEQVKTLKEKEQVPVILFHDREITAKALPQIIEKLKDLGYDFKRITVEDKPLQFTIKK